MLNNEEKELKDIQPENADNIEDTEQTAASVEENNEGQDNAPQNNLQDELAEMKDKYLRLFSEFENFRRRTAKEKIELIKTANEDLMAALLPVIDDFDRAKTAMGSEQADPNALKEGVDLIYNKFKKILETKGLKSMDSQPGTDFNTELHEAITQIPAPEESLKGKVVDTVESGYYLNEKVIRFAKVVIGN